jgi:diguanylate cyclase (GGDEF)-like protein
VAAARYDKPPILIPVISINMNAFKKSLNQQVLSADANLRRRLLLGSIGLAIAVSIIFIVVAFRLASGLGESIELEITNKQVTKILSHLNNKAQSADNQQTFFEQLDSDPLMVNLDADIVVLELWLQGQQHLLRTSPYNKSSDLLRVIKQNSQNAYGYTDTAKRRLFWRYHHDPQSDISLLIVRKITAFENALEYVADRLSITALLTFGLACWAALVMSAFITRRFEDNNRKLMYMATHDHLTGLPNRSYLTEKSQDFFSLQNNHRFANTHKKAAFLLVDLDKFKDVNDAMGHNSGDELLVSIAKRLSSLVDQKTHVVRYGGDEFVLWAEAMAATDATELAKKIISACREPILVGARQFEIGASIGIACYPDDGTQIDELFKHADIAMYRAKRLRLGYQLYQAEQNSRSSLRVDLRGQLNTALQQGQFKLYYQPKVQLADGQIAGLEALVRWRHPDHGLMAPGMFIDIIEQSAFVHEFTRNILKQAIQQCRLWMDEGIALCIAVNISAYNLMDAKFVSFITAQLAQHKVPAELLEIELTESATGIDIETTRKVFAQLHEVGVKLAIDDFGTGMSSLAYVKLLNVDNIKIDRSFITNIANDPRDEAVIKSMLVLCQYLNRKVVVEGVETEQQANKLLELGCELAQGNYFGKPMPADKMAILLKNSVIAVQPKN